MNEEQMNEEMKNIRTNEEQMNEEQNE